MNTKNISMFCNYSVPTTKSFKQTKLETELITSFPSELETLKPTDNPTRWTITYRKTITLFYPGRTITITTTDSKSSTTVFATYIPPSTVYVVKTIVGVVDEEHSISEFSSEGLWGIIMSLLVTTATLVFMVYT